ncbi:hypothetical protein SCHPADRAFT_81365 [Schizopora paradoxa]|uniref:Zn(2)-C6 fungal-type domain-containing protein n=1 Tax=Schizopora paradoxa TaxID=27342 RepID=A0A0H2S4P6_9AGAM|nr:hypothetical protein SCHPADRAFT_81365 [Schizopora paradoxa]
MDPHFAHAFPHDTFGADAFRPATVRSYPIHPIDLSAYNEPAMHNPGLVNPSMFVNPALIQNMPGVFPAPGGMHMHQHGNPTIHPAALHYGNVMPGQALGSQPFVGSPVSRPSGGANFPAPSSFSGAPRTSGFSRRVEGSSLGPSRHSVSSASGSEPYFCRTPNSTLRQRTAQACEKCRDRKTKCSGERPVCKRCSERGMVCKWAPETRVRGHSRSKASGQIPASDFQGEPLDALPHPITPLSTSSSDEQLAAGGSGASSAVKEVGESPSARHKRGSLSRAMAKKNLTAQRNSWPMGPPSSNLQAGGMIPQTSLQLPVSALGSTDDDSWDSVWMRREPQVDAAPVPGRAFDFESLIQGFDYNSGSSRGSSPPITTSNSVSDLSTLSSSIDSLEDLTTMLQSQLPAAEDPDFTAEMYDLLNLPASSSSSSVSSLSSVSSSPTSGSSPDSLFDGDFTEFAEAAKANGGVITDEITPVPQMITGQDDSYMSQYLSSEFLM